MGARAQRGERFAPGVGWLSRAQQRALDDAFAVAVLGGGEATSWVRWSVLPGRVIERTLRVLERHGLVDLADGDLVRLTAEGADLVRRWEEADV